MRFKHPSTAQGVAYFQILRDRGAVLLLRSCVFGRHEKPIYLGKPGSVLTVEKLPPLDHNMGRTQDVRKVWAGRIRVHP